MMALTHNSTDDSNDECSSLFNPLEEFALSFSPQPEPYVGTISIGLDTVVNRVLHIPLDVCQSKHTSKHERQHAHWDNIVLPQLISVYI